MFAMTTPGSSKNLPVIEGEGMSKTQAEQETETMSIIDKAGEVPATTGKSQGSRQRPESQIVYGNYGSIITTENRTWQYGGFPQPDGTFWQYREPNAVVV